jgi:aerobic-type carbon monoxide dehydrogenase small subunit (CoxS/CutS family)
MAMRSLRVNGSARKVDALDDETLLSVLRNRLGLTGTKYGCGEGQCGACTVLMDGKAVRSCRTKVSEAAGSRITTIEGLAQSQGGRLHPVQEAFLEEEAFQCGFCTPGMILSAVDLLRTNPHPTDEDVSASMAGNVCRCGTYPRIAAAIRRASAAAGAGKEPKP